MTDPEASAPIPEDLTAPGTAPRGPGPRAAAVTRLDCGRRGRRRADLGLPADAPRAWGIWGTDPNYSHGYLVLPVAALVAWRLGGPR